MLGDPRKNQVFYFSANQFMKINYGNIRAANESKTFEWPLSLSDHIDLDVVPLTFNS